MGNFVQSTKVIMATIIFCLNLTSGFYLSYVRLVPGIGAKGYILMLSSKVLVGVSI